jgi:two-component system, sporulation sensor kinase E
VVLIPWTRPWLESSSTQPPFRAVTGCPAPVWHSHSGMPPVKSSFLDKVLGRIGRLDPEGLQTVVQRLARERSFLETLFNTIEDGVLVVDEKARVVYFNQAVTHLLGLQHDRAEGQQVSRYLPGLDWSELLSRDRQGGEQVVRHEFEVARAWR